MVITRSLQSVISVITLKLERYKYIAYALSMSSTLFVFFLCLFTSISLAQEISYSLVDIDTGKTISNKNETIPIIPASTTKLYTSYYVLNQLKSTSTFETKIGITGKIESGTLNGDLILMPSGDPYITAQNLIALIHQVQNFGVKKVAGNLIIHPKNFWFTARLSEIGLEDQADNCSMGAFNVEFNRFKVDRYSDRPIPPMSYLKIESKNKAANGLKFSLQKSDEKQEAWLKYKKESHAFREEVPTRNSNLFGANYFKFLASLHGLELPDPQILAKEPKQIIASHTSLPLYRLVELGLEFSNNLIAEMLLQKINPSEPKVSAQVMLEWFKHKFPKLDWSKVQFVNGSGLDLANQTTTSNLSNLLAQIHHQQFEQRSFWSFLSINGHSGGISRRLTEPEHAFRIYAKTGSVYFVNNLAGYLIANSGKRYAFSIFTSHKKNRDLLNQENSKKVNGIRKKSKEWYQHSVQEIDSLISNWIKKY